VLLLSVSSVFLQRHQWFDPPLQIIAELTREQAVEAAGDADHRRVYGRNLQNTSPCDTIELAQRNLTTGCKGALDGCSTSQANNISGGLIGQEIRVVEATDGSNSYRLHTVI